MRPWLALRANNIAFEEVFIPLYTGDADKKRILGFTRSGKVPALIDDDVTIWDSLAIIEYIAEMFPEARLWPEDRARRAHARSISAEMHSGFMALRNECGMNLHRPVGAIALSADARANVATLQKRRAFRISLIRSFEIERQDSDARRQREITNHGFEISHLSRQ